MALQSPANSADGAGHGAAPSAGTGRPGAWHTPPGDVCRLLGTLQSVMDDAEKPPPYPKPPFPRQRGAHPAAAPSPTSTPGSHHPPHPGHPQNHLELPGSRRTARSQGPPCRGGTSPAAAPRRGGRAGVCFPSKPRADGDSPSAPAAADGPAQRPRGPGPGGQARSSRGLPLSAGAGCGPRIPTAAGGICPLPASPIPPPPARPRQPGPPPPPPAR